jgi:hypothetical protein
MSKKSLSLLLFSVFVIETALFSPVVLAARRRSSTTATTTAASADATDGSCGSADGGKYEAKPASIAELCAVGTASKVLQKYKSYSWTCEGLNGGSTASCSATKIVTYIPSADNTVATSSSENTITASSSTPNTAASSASPVTFTKRPRKLLSAGPAEIFLIAILAAAGGVLAFRRKRSL